MLKRLRRFRIGNSYFPLCGGNQARPKVIDSRSILAGVQGFESLPPHSYFFNAKTVSCIISDLISGEPWRHSTANNLIQLLQPIIQQIHTRTQAPLQEGGRNRLNINRRWTQIHADNGYKGFKFRLVSRNTLLFDFVQISASIRVYLRLNNYTYYIFQQP